MHRFRAWGLAAAITAAGAPVAFAADPPPAAADARPWYKRWFTSAPKPAPGPYSPPVSRVPAAAAQPLPPEVREEAMRAEMEAWSRRMEVCTRLRIVAEDTKNDALQKQADDLEKQATALYNQRAMVLGAPQVKPATATAARRADPVIAAAAAIDQKLGAGAAVTPDMVPTTPVPDAAVRTADAKGGRP